MESLFLSCKSLHVGHFFYFALFLIFCFLGGGINPLCFNLAFHFCQMLKTSNASSPCDLIHWLSSQLPPPPCVAPSFTSLLSSNWKDYLPFGLALTLLADGRPLIRWLTRSAAIALNVPDNKESGFRPLWGGTLPQTQELSVTATWCNAVSECGSAWAHLRPALCTFSMCDCQVPENGHEGGGGGSHSSHQAHTSCCFCVFSPLYTASIWPVCVFHVHAWESFKAKPESRVTWCLTYVIIASDFMDIPPHKSKAWHQPDVQNNKDPTQPTRGPCCVEKDISLWGRLEKGQRSGRGLVH